MSKDKYRIPGSRPPPRRDDDEAQRAEAPRDEPIRPTAGWGKLQFELRKRWFLTRAALRTPKGRWAAGALGASFLFFLFMATRGSGVASQHRARGIAAPSDAAAVDAAMDESRRRAFDAVANDSKLTDAQKAQQRKLVEAAAEARKKAAAETSTKQTPFGTQK